MSLRYYYYFGIYNFSTFIYFINIIPSNNATFYFFCILFKFRTQSVFEKEKFPSLIFWRKKYPNTQRKNISIFYFFCELWYRLTDDIINADTVKRCNEGWLDYLLPQSYWATNHIMIYGIRTKIRIFGDFFILFNWFKSL